MSRVILPAFTLLALFMISAASAQDLKNAAAEQKIAAQKIADRVGKAIDASYKQEAVDAKFALLQLVREVERSVDLFESQRTPLVQRLNARIRVVEESARGKKIVDDQR